jgi:hypothetical protein
LDVFESMGALAIVEVAIAFHLVWLCLETIAALYLDKRRARGHRCGESS